MITFLGISVSYEVFFLVISFLTSEVLPFLPNKYNGLAQSAVMLLGKVKLRKTDDRLELVLKQLQELEEKIDNPIPKDLDRALRAIRNVSPD